MRIKKSDNSGFSFKIHKFTGNYNQYILGALYKIPRKYLSCLLTSQNNKNKMCFDFCSGEKVLN